MGCGAEGEILAVFLSERLQAGDVRGEGELSVADGERGKWIGFADDGVAPANQRAAVDGGGVTHQSKSF
jgi:hypothetical protein